MVGEKGFTMLTQKQCFRQTDGGYFGKFCFKSYRRGQITEQTELWASRNEKIEEIQLKTFNFGRFYKIFPVWILLEVTDGRQIIIHNFIRFFNW